MSFERNRSLWWVLLPIFLGIFGGIIGYFILKNDDYKFARFCLNLSIVLTVIQLISLIPFIFFAQEIGQDFSVNV